MLAKTFGERLHAARRERSLSQGKLGDLVGVSRSTIAEWEAGRMSPQFERLEDISRALNKPVGWFFVDEDARKAPVLAADAFHQMEALRSAAFAVKQFGDKAQAAATQMHLFRLVFARLEEVFYRQALAIFHGLKTAEKEEALDREGIADFLNPEEDSLWLQDQEALLFSALEHLPRMVEGDDYLAEMVRQALDPLELPRTRKEAGQWKEASRAADVKEKLTRRLERLCASDEAELRAVGERLRAELEERTSDGADDWGPGWQQAIYEVSDELRLLVDFRGRPKLRVARADG